jgi:hypothetical protein
VVGYTELSCLEAGCSALPVNQTEHYFRYADIHVTHRFFDERAGAFF